MNINDSDTVITSRYLKDLNHIKNDLLTKLHNGQYIRFSRALNAVSALDITKDKYISYWKNIYVKHDEYLDTILEACEEKFKNGLISNEEMLILVNSSKDRTTDKTKAISLLNKELSRNGK